MKDTIITLAQELIAIPSMSGELEKSIEILELVKKQLPEYHCQPFVSHHHPSLLFSNQPDTKEFKIILNGHLDVVPASKDQFVPYIENGRLYGRGSFDMKAAMAVNILLFKELAHTLPYPIGLQVVTDEETVGLYGTGYQVGEGVRGDFVLIGECNSNFRIGNKAKGRKALRIIVQGESTHSAYAWLGQNALWKMYEVLDSIRKAFPPPTEETFNTTVNLTNIETPNPAHNKVPGSCIAHLDIRYTPEDEKTITDKLIALLPPDVTYEVDHVRQTNDVEASNAYIQKLQKEIKSVLGAETPLRYVHGTSDATYYAAVGCAAVEFGPRGEGAHNDREWVDIESLVEYYTILKNFLLAL